MLNTSLAPWPSYTNEEQKAVADILASGRVNYWTGEETKLFEKEFSNWVGTAHAVAVANGTLALDLALNALGIGPGDEVIVTPRTFIASVSCVVNAGGSPVFVDVDRNSGNMSPECIEGAVTPRTKAIICVHLAGWPCDMDELMAIAKKHGLYVIEDCAQAHGAVYKGRKVGSIGHVGAWSFCQDKIMTTGGEGGMVTTNDPDLWSRMWSFKDHGKSWEAVHNRQHPPGYRWLHESIGTNWRMLEIQAALGRIQLQRMRDWTAERRRNAMSIDEIAARFPNALRAPRPSDDVVHAYYRYYTYVRPDGLARGWDRDRITAEMGVKGMPVFSGSCSEVYLERAFEGTSHRPPERLPIAQDLGETSLMFLTHPTLSGQDIVRVTEAFYDVMQAATG